MARLATWLPTCVYIPVCMYVHSALAAKRSHRAARVGTGSACSRYLFPTSCTQLVPFFSLLFLPASCVADKKAKLTRSATTVGTGQLLGCESKAIHEERQVARSVRQLELELDAGNSRKERNGSVSARAERRLEARLWLEGRRSNERTN